MMKPLSAAYLAQLISHPEASRLTGITVSSIVINSLLVKKDTLFVALKGTYTDGHRFIRMAVEKGASLILAASSCRQQVESDLYSMEHRVLYVEDPLKALQMMAKAHIARYPSVTRVGVTGSCGKTTTKEMLSSILSQDGNVAKNPGNYNSEIGLALSAFEIDEESSYSVFEMGIDHVGEMDCMVDMYPPHIALITNIGLSHVGKMGSVTMTAKEKGKIFHPEIQHAFMEESSRWIPFVSKRQNTDVTPYGYNQTPFVRNVSSQGLEGWTFSYKDIPVHLRAIGRHNLSDAVSAITLAESIGMDEKEISEGLNSFTPVEGRSKVSYGDVTIIEDWYNSSVDSTSSILECISMLPVSGEKRIVLGSMKEMGRYSRSAHTHVSHTLRSTSASAIYLYGEEMKGAYDYLKRYRSSSDLFMTDEYEELQKRVIEDTRKGDLVLLKGSRAMQMERLVPAIHTIR